MKRWIWIVVQFILIGSTSFAQTLNRAKLDSFLNALASRDQAMGSLTISSKSVVLYEKVMGYSHIDNEKKTLALPEAKYKIGSTSKMFTAVMIFQLIEEGYLTLTQNLESYFPKLPNANKITIANLLNHRSGLHSYTEGTNFEEWMDQPKTHSELLKIITDKGADFEPNARTEYSNSNYLVLSYIIEKVCKSSYETALKKRIISKIGLPNTSCGKVPYNEVVSYKYADGKWQSQRQTDMGLHSGAGSIVSTPADMVKFIEALFSYQLINKRSLDRMKLLVDGYGMGIFPFNHGSKTGYGHNGRIEEFYSALRYFPEENLAIAYCTNGILYPRVDILNGIEKICFNEPFDPPFSKKIIPKSGDLDRYLGHYTSTQLPNAVNCLKEGDRLILETNGKTFDVTPVADNYFMHALTGTFFEFFPEKGELQIKETDNVYYLKRD